MLWNALRLTPVARWGPFQLADLVGWTFVVPAPLIAGVLLVRRRRALAALVLLPALTIFSIEYGPQFMPQAHPDGTAIRLLTSNLYFRNTHSADVAATIEHLHPDVIAMQELQTQMSGHLTAALKRRYPYRSVSPETGPAGLGVLSRWPIHVLKRATMAGGTCHCEIIRVQAPNRPFTLIDAHPWPPAIGLSGLDTTDQAHTLDAILRDARTTSASIVLGDFNTSDRSFLYRRLRSRFGDSFRDAGSGFGFSFLLRRVPFVRIDYVLHTKRWTTQSARLGVMPGSDHRFLLADLVDGAH